MIKPIQAKMLMFDLDDTLVDDSVATETAAKALFSKYQPQQINDALNHWKRALKLHYPAFLQGKLSAAEMRQARAREALQDNSLSDQEAEQAFEYFMQQYIAATILYGDTLDCLNKLKQQGWRLALVSNGPEDMQQRKVRAAGLLDYFEFVLTAEAAGAAKPKPSIFQQAAKLAKLNVEQCAYVGDNLVNDAQGANAAGMGSVWLQRDTSSEPEHQPMDEVNWKIASLNQLHQCTCLA
jgi:putative hydrolase of the HAD superfamily